MRSSKIREFILSNNVGDDGAVAAVIGRTGADVVCPDRRLIDASLAAIALADEAEPNLSAKLNAGLRQFYDPASSSYHELLDVTGHSQATGHIRSIGIQALAAWAAYRTGIIVGEVSQADEAQAYLTKLTNIATARNWASILDPAFEEVLDDRSSLLQVSLLVLAVDALTQPGDDRSGFFEAASAQLSSFVSDEGGLWAHVSPAGKPVHLLGYNLRASAFGVLAWAALHRRGAEGALDRAQTALRHISLCHRHATGSGFWNRANSKSLVTVDVLAATVGNDISPFPVKLTGDHAVLAWAASEIARLAGDINFENLAEEAWLECINYSDAEVGGVFSGLGSWFSTPIDPTVPLARHVMVAPRTVGAFSVGNTAYVPLHEKQAETQLLTLYAYEKNDALSYYKKSSAQSSPIELEPFPVKRDLSYVTTDKLSDNIIDIEAYLRWSESTKSGLGYGLTPYRSPLGLRSDKTAQTFSAVHVVSDLLTLGREVKDKEKVLAGIYATQNEDGGFAEQPALLSESFTTYCAVLTAKVLDDEAYNVGACIRFLQDCQHSEGGFGNAPGYLCDAWHSNLVVLALIALGERPYNEDGLIAFLVRCRNTDGGYGERPGYPSDTFATFRAIDTLIALGLKPPKIDETISWLQGLQTEKGGFRYRSGSIESFVGSYHAIAALYVMGALPTNVPACIEWIASRQSKDGGFSRQVNSPSDTTDEGFIAIQALHMLERKLNPYWAILMT